MTNKEIIEIALQCDWMVPYPYDQDEWPDDPDRITFMAKEGNDGSYAEMEQLRKFAELVRNATLTAVIEQGDYQYTGYTGPHSDFVLDLTAWGKQWRDTGSQPDKDA